VTLLAGATYRGVIESLCSDASARNVPSERGLLTGGGRSVTAIPRSVRRCDRFAGRAPETGHPASIQPAAPRDGVTVAGAIMSAYARGAPTA
jgi:hypothetical protein